jgi:hypothetical protein
MHDTPARKWPHLRCAADLTFAIVQHFLQMPKIGLYIGHQPKLKNELQTALPLLREVEMDG